MAMRSNGPIMLALPAFRGVTRRIILLALAVFFGLAILGLFARDVSSILLGLIVLQPEQALHRLIWQFVTYPFGGLGLLSVAFALLSVWFFGTALEDERGPRWMTEFFLATTIGGGLLASLLAYAARGRIDKLSVTSVESGMWPFVLALVLAFAYFHAEQPLRFNFILTLKAKYLAAIYLLFYLGSALVGGDRFGALVALTNGGRRALPRQRSGSGCATPTSVPSGGARPGSSPSTCASRARTSALMRAAGFSILMPSLGIRTTGAG